MSTSRFMPSRFTFHCCKSWNAFLCLPSTTSACFSFSLILISHSLQPSSLAAACAVSTSIRASVARMRCSSPSFPADSAAMISVCSLMSLSRRSSSSVSSSRCAVLAAFSSRSFLLVASIVVLFSRTSRVFSSRSSYLAFRLAKFSSASCKLISVCFVDSSSSFRRWSPDKSFRHLSFSMASSRFACASWLSWICSASAWSTLPVSIRRTVFPSSIFRSSHLLTVKTCQLFLLCSSTSMRSTNHASANGGAPLTGGGAL
mmetsp:Transcript_27154/g.45420  ORF Transcript_27154/g.45420 Transcript_27154/m.45420 type:complete len:259 (-) Transcript_27154:700-1476(-)